MARLSHKLSGKSSRIVVITLLALISVGAVGTWSVFAWDLGTAQTPTDRKIAKMVTYYLRSDHLSKHPLDNEISQRALKMFLKNLDPMKIYLLQSDVDEFMKRENEVDDMVKDGDVSLAYQVFGRFLERVDQRIKVIDELIQMDHDFTVDEDIIVEPELLKYAKNAEESKDRWRKRIKYDLLVLKAEKVEKEEAKTRLNRRYHGFAKRMHQIDSDELLEWYLSAVTSSFDPHTSYMSPSSYDNFLIQMRLNLEGIGAALQLVDGYTVVSKVIPGGPADKDGRLKPEDRIVSVGQGEDGELVDVVDMKLNDVVQMIRGRTGTVVRVNATTAGGTESKQIKLTRAKIELKDSEARGEIFEEGRKSDGSPYRIGYIDLPSFYMDMQGARQNQANFKSSTNDVRRILENFNSKGVDAVVLDLRHNGGGSLTEAINLTGLFIDQGPVVQVKDPDGRVQQYEDLEQGMVWGGPMVVMTSKFSASASEILAGAIQDYGRGLIVGDDATHGKGTVQTMMDLAERLFRDPKNRPNYGALKISVQQFYRPNGDSTQKRGVLADIHLPSITNHMDVSESDLDYSMEFDRVSAARFDRMDQVNAELVRRLQRRSDDRRDQSEDFQKLVKNVDKYVETKGRKSISLKEDDFFTQRGEIDAEKEEEKRLEEQANGKETVKRDYYLNEVFHVTADYIGEGRGKRVVKAN